MTLPASGPGRLLERSGDAAPRGMTVHDRTRLIGRLRHLRFPRPRELGLRDLMTLPASGPGRLLERSGDAAPRGMTVHDRTRLIGRLRHLRFPRPRELGLRDLMTLPASGPGRLLERSGDAAPRGMTVHDRTRLIGRLRPRISRAVPRKPQSSLRELRAPLRTPNPRGFAAPPY